VRRAAVAFAAVALAAGAGCTTGGSEEPIPGTLAEYLEVDLEECGLDDGP
jgi:hypothetical protein